MRASLWRRLGALLYDSMLVAAIWMVTAGILIPLNANQALSGAAWQSFLFVEAFFFYTYFWRTDGQTVGMMAWRLKLVSDDGSPLSWYQLTVRVAGALLSAGCFGLGYLWALVDPLGRTWADRMSGTHILLIEPKQTA